MLTAWQVRVFTDMDLLNPEDWGPCSKMKLWGHLFWLSINSALLFNLGLAVQGSWPMGSAQRFFLLNFQELEYAIYLGTCPFEFSCLCVVHYHEFVGLCLFPTLGSSQPLFLQIHFQPLPGPTLWDVIYCPTDLWDTHFFPQFIFSLSFILDNFSFSTFHFTDSFFYYFLSFVEFIHWVFIYLFIGIFSSQMSFGSSGHCGYYVRRFWIIFACFVLADFLKGTHILITAG